MTARLVHRREALASGMNAAELDQLFRQRRRTWVLPQVYWTGPLPSDPALVSRLRIRATQWWLGECVISGLAAAFWNGWLSSPPEVVDVRVGPDRRVSKQPGIAVRRGLIAVEDVVDRAGVHTTGAERTALDLAAAGNTDLLDTMLRRGWYDRDAVAAALVRGAGQRGWVKARQAVEESATRPFSAPERILHRRLHQAGVAGWVANPCLLIKGRKIFPDLLFEAEGLVVEIDGHAFHSTRDAFETDRERQNRLVAAGYRVLRFTWRQLTDDPAGVVRRIQDELLRSAA